MWTPDGQRVAFSSNPASGVGNLFWKAADGTGEIERLTDSPHARRRAASGWPATQFPYAFSPDGTRLVYRENHPDTGIDLGVLSMEGDRPMEALLATEFTERNAELSPDGRRTGAAAGRGTMGVRYSRAAQSKEKRNALAVLATT